MEVYFIGEKQIFDNSLIKTCDIEYVYNYLKDKSEISIDIETTKLDLKYEESGLDPHTSKIVMLQIGDLEKQFVIDTRFQNIDIIKDLLSNSSIVKVGHNLKFEYKHIYHNYGIILENLYDTQIVEEILNCGIKNVEFGLKALVKRYLNIELEKDTRLEFLKIKDKPFTTTQILYGAKDILYPLEIKKLQEEKIIKQQLQSCVDLEMKFIPVLGDIEYKGMNFNTQKWIEIYNRNKPLLHKQSRILDQYVVDNYLNSPFIKQQMDLFITTPQCNIKWTSTQQVVAFLKYLNACPQEVSKQTKKLEYTSNAVLLKSSLNGINKDKNLKFKQFVEDFIKFKELEQSCTTFGLDFFKYINPKTKRIHTNFKQILNTGRISSKNPNLQNIPSEEEYRKCFDASVGFKIVNADYSGQEQIVLVNKSQDEGLIKFYKDNLGDMHSYVASKIFKEISHLSLDDIKKLHKDKRQIAKSAGFAINYGGNGYTIAKNIGVSTEQGEEVYNAYFNAFPGLKNYFEKVQKQAIQRGYILIDTLTHRKSYFTKPRDNKELHAIYKKALNYPK